MICTVDTDATEILITLAEITNYNHRSSYSQIHKSLNTITEVTTLLSELQLQKFLITIQKLLNTITEVTNYNHRSY